MHVAVFTCIQLVAAIVTVLPSNHLGSVILIGSCDHHQRDYIINEEISFEVITLFCAYTCHHIVDMLQDPFSPSVNYSITILIIAHHQIIPNHVVVFNHHDNQVCVDMCSLH